MDFRDRQGFGLAVVELQQVVVAGKQRVERQHAEGRSSLCYRPDRRTEGIPGLKTHHDSIPGSWAADFAVVFAAVGSAVVFAAAAAAAAGEWAEHCLHSRGKECTRREPCSRPGTEHRSEHFR